MKWFYSLSLGGLEEGAEFGMQQRDQALPIRDAPGSQVRDAE